MEWQTVETLIKLLLQEQSDLGLHCLHISFGRNFGVRNFRTFVVASDKRSIQIVICCWCHLKCLSEAFLTVHNGHFHGEIKKNIDTFLSKEKKPTLSGALLSLDTF